ncbi:MAG: hypothetical protein ACE5E6_12445 [Phycisphaerae bacterium]
MLVTRLGSPDPAVILYEGNALPERVGFERIQVFDADRWVHAGRFFQQIDIGAGSGGPYDGEYDGYQMALRPFIATPFFTEWRMMTDAPDSEVDGNNGGARMIAVGGGVNYHFNMASGLALILRGYPFPTLYFDIDPGVPHTYRLEVYGADYFEFRIDDIAMDSGLPEAEFPTADALVSFGGQYFLSDHRAQWDYVRFGTIPIDGSGDYDSDGDVDHADFAMMHECLYGYGDGPPGGGFQPAVGFQPLGGPDATAPAGCRFADFDHDADVDLRDIAACQNAFTGGR